jgi:octaprenyl-diphosphate synthase
LNNTDRATRKKIIYIVKNESGNKEKVKYVLDAVARHNGIEYTHEKMLQYKMEALALLDTFPDSEIKTGFEQLVQYVTDRKY